MQHIIDKLPKMSNPSDTTKREGIKEKKKIAVANEIINYKDKYMYDDKGNKYPVSTTTTSKGSTYGGQLYKRAPAPRVK